MLYIYIGVIYIYIYITTLLILDLAVLCIPSALLSTKNAMWVVARCIYPDDTVMWVVLSLLT